jgi:hypothetical protein
MLLFLLSVYRILLILFIAFAPIVCAFNYETTHKFSQIFDEIPIYISPLCPPKRTTFDGCQERQKIVRQNWIYKNCLF